jgi:electron transfer flavoprotein beta subunit
MLDEGIQTVRVKLPAVLTVSIEINEPRYPNFMGIRKASRMQYPATGAGDLPGLDTAASAKTPRWCSGRTSASPRLAGGKVEFIQGGSPAEQAAALVDKLIAEKVI